MNTTFSELSQALPHLALRSDVPYREITTLGIGSTLPLLAEPATPEELAELLRFTSSRGIPVIPIGGGTNLIGMDAPCPRIGIRPIRTGFNTCRTTGKTITAGAMIRLPELASKAAEEGLRGLAKLAGIPGTLGGAIRMNAGANGVAIGNFVSSVEGIRFDGTPWHAAGKELTWGYRAGSVPDDVIITSVTLELEPGDREQEAAAIRAELDARRGREPSGRSAGCTFRNISEFEPAGKLIDQCGLKGYRIGDLQISSAHANYILNTGSGSESQYLMLLTHIRRAVAETTGFYLRPEVCFFNPDATGELEKALKPPRVNVLLGGTSSEREISLLSGNAVAQALRNAGFDVVVTDVGECRIYPEMFDADVVYPVLHGGFGEDGRLQKLLEDNDLKFVGSGSAESRLVMDKIATKRLLDQLGIPTARWHVVTRDASEIPADLVFPVILKAPMEGSTIGITKVDRPEDWEDALTGEFRFSGELLVEEFIEGIEITVPIVNGKVLPAIEIKSPHGFYNYDAKYVYKDGHTEYFCPPVSLTEETLENASEYARKFYLAAGCRDILRVDFIVDRDGVPRMLEGNSLPGCTATSLVPKAARVAGCSFERMTSILVYAAMKRGGAPRNARPEKTEVRDGENLPPQRRANPVLLRLCRLLFRLALVLCALPFLISGFQMAAAGNPAGWQLLLSGVFILSAEFIFTWLNQQEKTR